MEDWFPCRYEDLLRSCREGDRLLQIEDLCSCLEGDCLLQFEDLLDREDRLEGGEDLLECVDLLGIKSFRGGEGLMEGAVLV